MRSSIRSPIASSSSKPEILFLLHLPPPVHGSSVMGKQIRESTRVNDAFSCRYLNLLASRQIQSSGKLTLGKLIGFFSTAVSLLRMLIQRRPDAAYLALTTTGIALLRDAVLISVLRLAGIPRVYHLHNKGVSRHGQHALYSRIYRLVFQDASVVVLSRHLQSDISAFVSPERVYVCPNGIADEFGAKDETRAAALPGPRLLFLSNLVITKGVMVLLQACALLARRGIGFHCVLVGAEGDITAEAINAKIDELGLVEQVAYLGPQHGASKHAEFAKAEIFVLPTYNECFPLVILEAMQFGLPVVSCPEGGIADQVIDGETGFLVPQRDAAALADRLAELINDAALRRAMGRRARQRYEERFTAEQFEDRFVQVLAEAAGVELPAAQPEAAR